MQFLVLLETLIGLYLASAQGLNQLLAGIGSNVTAPTARTREWTWNDAGTVVTIVPLPSPEPEPTPAE
jgi:hypothetical protein